jgi:hypothetical protein
MNTAGNAGKVEAIFTLVPKTDAQAWMEARSHVEEMVEQIKRDHERALAAAVSEGRKSMKADVEKAFKAFNKQMDKIMLAPSSYERGQKVGIALLDFRDALAAIPVDPEVKG